MWLKQAFVGFPKMWIFFTNQDGKTTNKSAGCNRFKRTSGQWPLLQWQPTWLACSVPVYFLIECIPWSWWRKLDATIRTTSWVHPRTLNIWRGLHLSHSPFASLKILWLKSTMFRKPPPSHFRKQTAADDARNPPQLQPDKGFTAWISPLVILPSQEE